MIENIPGRGSACLRAALLILFTVFLSVPAQAGNTTAPKAEKPAEKAAATPAAAEPADKPKKVDAPAVSENALPVFIEHEGRDQAGERLVFKLREFFKKHPDFKLAKKDDRAIKLRIASRVEIPERPYFGSVYSVVWLFVEGKDVLAYYLDNTLDFVAAATLDEDVEALAARTDKVAAKYSYLME